MYKLMLLLLLIPLCGLQAQRVGINTTNPQATLHVAGNLKFNPKATIEATRLVGVTASGAVREFELGDGFNIVNGTLVVNEIADENVFYVGDLDQSATAGSSQYDNYDVGIQNNNAVNTIIRMTGETSNYNITGFANGYPGRVFYLYNAQTVNVTFTNYDSASLAANQIDTGSGSSVGISGEGVAEFIYDGDIEKWILINIRN